jgi:Tol biopolymer transport system component
MRRRRHRPAGSHRGPVPVARARVLPAIALALAIAGGGCSSNEPAPPAPSNLPYFQRLTGTSVGETSPALSPDGTRVAYERSDEIWVLGVASRSAARVAPRGNHPSWSSDGQSVLFVRRDLDGGGPLHRLVRLHLASGALDTLSADTVDVYEPAAAPLGDAVAMRILSRVNTLQSLRVVGGDGRDQATLTPAGPWVDTSPAWSADGAWIAFVRVDDAGTARLYRVPAAGDLDAAPVGTGTQGAAGPTWHPDGRIVFSRNGVLSWVSPGGGPVSVLVDEESFAVGPTISADGKRLVFSSDRSGNFELWQLVDPAGIGTRTYLHSLVTPSLRQAAWRATATTSAREMPRPFRHAVSSR